MGASTVFCGAHMSVYRLLRVTLSRCCLYQATRGVDVAVEAPAVSVVSERWGVKGNGILCSVCVVSVCKVHTCSPGQPGVVCCHFSVAARVLSMRTCCAWGIAAFDPNVLVLDNLQVAAPQ
jgi:hypothetical protein